MNQAKTALLLLVLTSILIGIGLLLDAWTGAFVMLGLAAIFNGYAVRQSHPRHAHVEMTFMLEEVEVTQSLDLRVVNRMLPRRLGVSKPGAGREIDPDRQPPLRRIEIDSLDEPWRLDAKGRLKQLIGHDRCGPPPAAPARSAALLRSQHGRRAAGSISRPSACGFVDGAAPRPQLHRLNAITEHLIVVVYNPLEIQKRHDSRI
jgi:hypothetical protein